VAPDAGARTAILNAALEAFSRDGFDGASLPKIGAAANIGHTLIIYYFGSKDNLWRETVDFAFGGLMIEAATIEAASRDLSPLDRLRVLIRAFALFAARHPSHLGLIMAEARADTERLRWLQDNYTNRFVDNLQRILVEAQDAGQVKAIPVMHLDFIIIGSLVLYFSVESGLPRKKSADELAVEHADWVLDVLLNGVAVRPAAAASA
jgi:AcrR family transcriptional regulator